MKKENSEFVTSFVSEAGTFRDNKDYFAYTELDDYACWITADGVDSAEEKESAEIVVHSLFESFIKNPTLSRRKIKQYLFEAHQKLKEASKSIRRKVSLVMVVTNYNKIIWIIAGNARFYHFRNKMLNFVSKDQSLAQQMVRRGQLKNEQVNEHEERNNLTNYFGTIKKFKPYISPKYRLKDQDVCLLATAGMWEQLDFVDINNVVKEAEEAEEVVDTLEEFLLEKQSKVINNYTLVAVFTNKVVPEKALIKKETLKRVAVIVLPLLLMLVIGLFASKYIAEVRAKMAAKAQAKQEAIAFRINAKKNIAAAEDRGNELVQEGNYPGALQEYQKAKEDLERLESQTKNKDEAMTTEIVEKKERLKLKYQLTKKIIAGDKEFESKNYRKALVYYREAKNKITQLNDYHSQDLKQKIKKAQGYLQVINLAEQGDLAMARQNHAAAKLKYQEGIILAEQVFFQEMRASLQVKLNELEVQNTAKNKQAKKLKEAKQLEQIGDQKLAAQDYDAAIMRYTTAQKIFAELEKIIEASLVEDKLKKAEEAKELASKPWWKKIF